MEPVPSEQYPVIDSVRSNFDLFLASLPDLVGRAADLIDRASQVLSDENIASFSEHACEHREERGHAARRPCRDAAAAVAELKATMADVRAAAAGARKLVETSGPDLADGLGAHPR